MTVRYPNLINTNLLEIKKKYPDLAIAFKFLDKLTFELKKISLKEFQKGVIIFIDYKTGERFFLDIDETNSILTKCYYEFYLKEVLEDVNQKIKTKLSQLDDKWLNIFLKNLFIVIKSFFYKKKKQTIKYYFFLSAILNSSVIDFSDVVEYNEYSVYVKEILKKLDYSVLSKYFEFYFVLSYDNLSFSVLQYNNDYCRFYTYFDLENYLKGRTFPNDSLIVRFDKSIQLLILICFLNSNYFFYKKIYCDNSYIHSRIGSEEKITQFEFENHKECLHFNNL